MRPITRKRALVTSIALAAAVIALGLCVARSSQSRVTATNFVRVTRGMTKAEVIAILGPPGDYRSGPSTADTSLYRNNNIVFEGASPAEIAASLEPPNESDGNPFARETWELVSRCFVTWDQTDSGSSSSFGAATHWWRGDTAYIFVTFDDSKRAVNASIYPGQRVKQSPLESLVWTFKHALKPLFGPDPDDWIYTTADPPAP